MAQPVPEKHPQGEKDCKVRVKDTYLHGHSLPHARQITHRRERTRPVCIRATPIVRGPLERSAGATFARNRHISGAYIVLVVAQARITSNTSFPHPALARAPRHCGRRTNPWPDMPHKGQRRETLQYASTGKGHMGNTVPIEPLEQRMQHHQP